MRVSPNLLQIEQQLAHVSPAYEDSFFNSNPVFIVSTPRSGSALLFEQLQTLDRVWTIGSESHGVFAQFPHLRFEDSQLSSGCLTPAHADVNTQHYFKLALLSQLRNRNNTHIFQHQASELEGNVFIEKTPRNALNIAFIKTIFPQARFIYLYREPNQNTASILEAWKKGEQTGQFVTFQNLPGWDRKNWCLLLPRGWKNMNEKSLAEIAFFQWQQSNLQIINDLKPLPPSDWCALEYQTLLDQPSKSIKKLVDFCRLKLKMDEDKFKVLGHSKTTVSAPDANKWKKYQSEFEGLSGLMSQTQKTIQAFIAQQSTLN